MPTSAESQALREATPGHDGWARTARTGDPDKYFVVSADCHAMEPNDWVTARIDSAYLDRLPKLHVDEKGETFILTEGNRPWKLQKTDYEGEDLERYRSGKDPLQRIADQERDGVDVEIVFPNKGMHAFGTNGAGFSMAMCRAWNDWAHEAYRPHRDRILPMAMVPTMDVDAAIAELHRVAALGFSGITIPCKPDYGPSGMDGRNYNLPEFEPLWSAVEDVDLPVTLHVSTGRDPRASTGPGGAVINYAIHCCSASLEPVANLCASGILERHPRLRFATIEAGIGWVPWLLIAMDEAFYKHHMWVRPRLSEPPSYYFRRQGFASFGDDPPGLQLAVEHDLVDNFMWANDYPHHEGTWPHSAAAIERTMGHLDEAQRAKILGGNAARFFGITIPAGRA
ncbi:MAG: amidohydrolase family protein [Acidimicrobiales bacterium]